MHDYICTKIKQMKEICKCNRDKYYSKYQRDKYIVECNKNLNKMTRKELTDEYLINNIVQVNVEAI